MIINSVYSDRNKAESDYDPGKAAAALRTDLEFEKRREERMKRRLRDRAMPAKPMTKFPAMSDEAFEIKKQELSAMVAKAVSEKSTMADEAFKRRKQLLFASVDYAMARNENSTLSHETLMKRKLELSALMDKIGEEFTRSSTTMSCSSYKPPNSIIN